MTVTRRTFLVALSSVPFLQLPAHVPVSPVPGWTFLWHEWDRAFDGSMLCGYWSAISETRGVFNPVSVIPRASRVMRDTAKAEAYTELVAWTGKLTPLAPDYVACATAARQWARRRV